MRRYVAVLLALLLAVPCLAATVVLVKKTAVCGSQWTNTKFYWRFESTDDPPTLTEGTGADHSAGDLSSAKTATPEISTAQYKHGAKSGLVNASNEYWTFSNSPEIVNWSNSTSTAYAGRVGAWIYATSWVLDSTIFDTNDSDYAEHNIRMSLTTNADMCTGGQTRGVMAVYRVPTTPIYIYHCDDTLYTVDTWLYVELAWSRPSGTSPQTGYFDIYVNGTLRTSGASRSLYLPTQPTSGFFIGNHRSPTPSLYIDDFVITNSYSEALYGDGSGAYIAGATGGYCTTP